MARADAKVEALDRASLIAAFEACISRRCYKEALALCRRQLKAKPKDPLANDLYQTVEAFVEASDELEIQEAANADEELPPPLEELYATVSEASDRAFESMLAYLREDEERVWEIGSWTIGAFWDAGQNESTTSRRERLMETSTSLLQLLLRRLRLDLPSRQTSFDDGEWLLEAAGELWWLKEFAMPVDPWLAEGICEQWAASRGSMETLVGFSKQTLQSASISDLYGVLTNTVLLERASFCGLSAGSSQPFTLEYGVELVFAEIGRRPLIEAPLEGFFECFHLLTHIVYAVNGYNACLPNRRADFPWVYAYLERSLAFLVREARSKSAELGDGLLVGARWRLTEAIAEAVDCLRGLGQEDEISESDVVREAVVWLLSRQDADDGFFYSPGVVHRASGAYAQVRPTWAALLALQLERTAKPLRSATSQAWTAHARKASEAARFSAAPPPRRPQELSGEGSGAGYP